MKNFRVTVIALTFMLVIGGVLHSTMKANMGLSNDLGSPDFNKRGAIDEDFGTQGDLKKIVNPRGAIYEFNNGIVGDIFVKKEDGHLVCTSPGEIHGVATGDTIVYELVVSEKDSYKLGQCYRIRGSLNDSFTEMRDINRINGYKYHKAWNVGSGAKVVPHVVIQAGNTFVEVANPRCKVSTVSPRRILFELNGWDVVVSPDGKLISAYLGGMTGYGVFDLKGQKIFSHSTGDRTWSSDSSKLFWINDGKVQVTKFDSEAGTVVGTSVVTLEN